MLVDIKEKIKRKKFIEELLGFTGVILKNSIRTIAVYDLMKEKIINSKFPISINMDNLEIDCVKNTKAFIKDKNNFVTPEYAISKVKEKSDDINKYIQEVKNSLINCSFGYSESVAEKITMEDIETIMIYYYEGETALDCALDIGYHCG